METTNKKSYVLKWISAFFVALQLSFVFTPTVAAVSEENYEPTEEEIEEVADMIQYMYEEAATTNFEGYVVDFDFDVVREKYGDSEDLRMVESETDYDALSDEPVEIITQQSFGECMSNAFASTFGVYISGATFSALSTYLKAGSWKAAAKAFLAVLGSKFTLAAVAGWLAWNTGACL